MNSQITLKDRFENAVIAADARLSYATRVFETVRDGSRNIASPQFSRLATTDLHQLFIAIDQQAFSGSIAQFCLDRGFPVRFRLGKRMTKTGGTTTRRVFKHKPHQPEFEIAISPSLLFNTFRDSQAATVAGVNCSSAFDALRLIMEHEILHLAEMLLWNQSSCAGQRFRGASGRLFGHRSSKHELLTPAHLAKQKFGITVGDRVSFRWEGRQLEGTVNRLTQRATVLVPDQRGIRYTDGNFYAKYYVPLRMLEKAGCES